MAYYPMRNCSCSIIKSNLERRICSLRNLEKIRPYSSSTENLEYLKVSKVGAKNNVGLIQLNRPEARNALCDGLLNEMSQTLDRFESDSSVGAVVITGNEQAFAAGADIKEMSSQTFTKWITGTLLDGLQRVATARSPIIAAVNGFALGGGCELAMMCDIIYAGENAKFAQLEILLGIIPGSGGTQRLTRCIGKSKAMEMVLTGKQVSAQEAEKMGLVSKVLPVDKVLEESIKLAEKIASNSYITNSIAKECCNQAYETSLRAGLVFERRMFHALFSTNDQKEGMKAFMEKRRPNFSNE